MINPLLIESPYKYGAPAFDKISLDHYMPAFEAAIKEGKEEVDAIINNSQEPNFKNTIKALEYAGRTLNRVSAIFYNLNHANTNEQMQAIAESISPMMTEYSLYILLNEKLFERIKKIYEQKDDLNLSKEDAKLLENTYKGFADNGANLSTEDKAKLSKISEELSLASLKFDKNVLDATNEFTLNITDETELAGLPDFVKEGAAHEAKTKGTQGWIFTLQYPSYAPFMQFSENRELRKQMWMANGTKALNGKFSNQEIVKNIVDLRIKEANLLGYEFFAEYALKDRMAKNSETVNKFLSDLLDKSLPYAKKEITEITEYAQKNGFNEELMPWDFAFWSEKLKKERYNINDEVLKPYFELESVKSGIFGLAHTLWGINFTKIDDVPAYHPDVEIYNVTDTSGKHLALFYADFFPRESKNSGAWMTSYREQGFTISGEEERPHISIVCNFSKPTESTPSLLTFNEVITFLHEFGHALHGIFAEGKYQSLTGTNVTRDFVELPSQILENWGTEKEFLASFAKHYQTGEVIPQEFITKIIDAKNYNSGYASVRQLSFGINDMAWHTLKEVPTESVLDFEKSAINRAIVLPDIKESAVSTSFGHIFAGGYAAGYYSYKWAEVLEADAFQKFKEEGIFNKEVAESFRKNILSMGGIESADALYRNFRGRDPKPEALFEKLGLK